MYTQITLEERYTIARCRVARMSVAEIATITGRHRSTIYREIARSLCNDGRYRAFKAQRRTNGRRSRSRRNRHFGQKEWTIVERFLREKWSPEQISGRLAEEGILRISHETCGFRRKRTPIPKLCGHSVIGSEREPELMRCPH